MSRAVVQVALVGSSAAEPRMRCRLVLADERDRFGAVGGFGDDVHVGLAVDEGVEAVTDECLVVGEQAEIILGPARRRAG